MVLIEQISALIDYLECHQELALGYCSRTNEGRSLAKRRWAECAQILNSISVDCPNKTPAEWRTFYNEYKSKVLKKIKLQKSEISATGGGPAKKIDLTPLQERLLSILGRDVGEPLPGVRHNPLLTQTISIPLVDSPTITYQDDSFSLLDNYEGPLANERQEDTTEIEPPENVQPQQISFIQETVAPEQAEPSTSIQPPKRRKRQRSAAEGRDHAALEAAQSRLDAIEARNAEATSKQAEATLKQAEATLKLAEASIKQSEAANNLAAAITKIAASTDKMVKVVDCFLGSISKKKVRRIIMPSDSESD